MFGATHKNFIASDTSIPFMVMNLARDVLRISVAFGALFSPQLTKIIICRRAHHSNASHIRGTLALYCGEKLPRAGDKHYSDDALVRPSLRGNV
jgi:hypothetical protein